MAVASLAYAEAPNPVLPHGSRPPKKDPTPAPTAAPSATPLLGQIQVQMQKDPIRVEGEMKPVEAKPIELKPLQVQLPTEIKVSGSGIPEKSKLEWEVKPIPLDLRWPKEPMKVAFDSKAETTSKQKEIIEKIDTLEKERNNDKKQIRDLNEKLALQRDGYRDGIERTLRSGGLPDDKVSQLLKDIEIQRIEWWGKPYSILMFIIMSGFIGGIFGVIETRRNDSKALPTPERHIVLGIAAALMVPGVLYFIPGRSLQAASQNQYLLVSLCSLCFIVAMVGELFIAAVLQWLRRRLQEWANE